MKSETKFDKTTKERGGVQSLIQARLKTDVSEAQCLLFSYIKKYL